MRAVPLLLAITLVANPAQARQTTDGSAKLVDALNDCRAIEDPDERLACYDRAAGALVQARERKEIVVLDREEVQQTRRSLFGLSLPRLGLFGADGEPLKEISGKAESVAQVESDRWQVRLDDDSRWQTTESARGFPPRTGESVTIRRAALGSYLASFDGRRALRVKRVN